MHGNDQLWRDGAAALRTLRAMGVHGAITGTLAATAWGAQIAPGDVDVEVSQHGLFAALSFGAATCGALDVLAPLVDALEAAQLAPSEVLASLGVQLAPSVDVVNAASPCCPLRWTWRDGVPVVPAGYLIFRALLRAGDLSRALRTGDKTDPRRDIALTRELLRVAPGASMPSTAATPALANVCAILSRGASDAEALAALRDVRASNTDALY